MKEQFLTFIGVQAPQWVESERYRPPMHSLKSASSKTFDHLLSHDSQVAEGALSLSDFNPGAKMVPNPDPLSETRQGA